MLYDQLLIATEPCEELKTFLAAKVASVDRSEDTDVKVWGGDRI